MNTFTTITLIAAVTLVRHLGGDTPLGAISIPNADVGGLVNWVHAHRGAMSKNGQLIFSDLELLGIDLRTRGSDGDDSSDRVLIRI